MADEKCCVKILRQIRPQWPKCDIVLRKISKRAWIGYSIENIKEKLFIKLLESESQASSEICRALEYSDLGLSPKILGTFSHGYVTQYCPQSDSQMLQHPSVYPLVAEKIGCLHRQLSLSKNISKEICIFETLSQMLERLSDENNNNNNTNSFINNNNFGESLPDPATILEELHHIQATMSEMSIPRIIGHSNFSADNILYSAFDKTVLFTGLKKCGYVMQAMELASLFLSLHGVNRLSNEFVLGECLPGKGFQLRWINNYLAALNDVSLHQVSMSEINTLYRQISVCSLLYLIRQSVWAVIFLKQSDDNADSQDWIKNKDDILLTYNDKYSDVSRDEIIQFGISRFKLYQKLKYNIMAFEI